MSTHFGGFGSASSNLRDCYGFEKPAKFNEKEYEAFLSEYLPVLAKRTKRWGTMMTTMNSTQIRNQGYFESMKLKRFVRKGIPTSLRPKLWVLFTGVSDKLKEFPDEFERLRSKTLNDESEQQIHLDLNRTFPDNHFFKSISGDITKKILCDILHAIAIKHPDIGYCQGLNYLSGMLLLVLKAPEPAFWLMDKMLFDLPEYYTHEMRGLKTDVMVLTELIRERCPLISDLFKRYDFDLLMVTSKWFLCWYMETIPIETVLRIWDCLFHEGPKILFRVAITLIIMNKDRILQCTSFSDIVGLFKKIVNDSSALHCHQFMLSIFEVPGTLSWATIQNLRERFKPKC